MLILIDEGVHNRIKYAAMKVMNTKYKLEKRKQELKTQEISYTS